MTKAAAEVAAKAAAEAIVAIVWFIGCGKSTKGRQNLLFLLSYIYRVRKAVD